MGTDTKIRNDAIRIQSSGVLWINGEQPERKVGNRFVVIEERVDSLKLIPVKRFVETISQVEQSSTRDDIDFYIKFTQFIMERVHEYIIYPTRYGEYAPSDFLEVTEVKSGHVILEKIR